VRTLDDLPAAARRFLDRVAVLVGAPVTMVGLGRDREALVRAVPAAGAREGG